MPWGLVRWFDPAGAGPLVERRAGEPATPQGMPAPVLSTRGLERVHIGSGVLCEFAGKKPDIFTARALDGY